MVALQGWVNAKRVVGGIVFLEIIPENLVQPVTAVFKKSENRDLWKEAKKVKIGTAVRIEGEYSRVRLSKRGEEFKPTKFEVITPPVDILPIDLTGKTPVLFDTKLKYRYLMLRLPKERAIFKIRARLLKHVRDFLEKNDFLEVHTPKIVGAGAEGGATLFELDYFGRKAFLAQSPQLYKQMLITSIPRVYEITPYFRAEQHHTTRHLNECWGIDVEMGFISSVEDILKLLEELLSSTIEYIRETCKEELEILGVDLKLPRRPFPRLTYDNVIQLLEERGIKVTWGEDLSDREERVLGSIMKEKGYDLYFIVRYPWETKPFYIMRRDGYSESFDLDYKGLEISSGGQREHRYTELLRNIRDKGLDPMDFEFYLEAFKYGMPPHGGFGLGVERLLMKMLDMENIRETIIFTRDIHRFIP